MVQTSKLSNTPVASGAGIEAPARDATDAAKSDAAAKSFLAHLDEPDAEATPSKKAESKSAKKLTPNTDIPDPRSNVPKTPASAKVVAPTAPAALPAAAAAKAPAAAAAKAPAAAAAKAPTAPAPATAGKAPAAPTAPAAKAPAQPSQPAMAKAADRASDHAADKASERASDHATDKANERAADRAADRSNPDRTTPNSAAADKPGAQNAAQAKKVDPKGPVKQGAGDATDARNDALDAAPNAPASRDVPTAKLASKGSKTNGDATDAVADGTTVAAAPMAKKSDSTDEPDVLKVLGGKLDQVDPAKIPGIVMGSQFIGMAMTSDNMQGFFQTPQPTGDLVDALKASPGFLNKKLNGAQLPDSISPQDLFRKLGMDTQSVMSELTTMRDHLETDGLQSYVQRAENLQQKVGGPAGATLGAAAGQAAMQDQRGPQTVMANPNAPSMQDAKFSSTPKTLPGPAGKDASFAAASAGAAVPNPMAMTGVAGQAASNFAGDAAKATPVEASAVPFPIDAIRGPADMNIPMFGRDAIKQVSFDPFAKMGQEMKPMGLETFTFGQERPVGPLDPLPPLSGADPRFNTALGDLTPAASKNPAIAMQAMAVSANGFAPQVQARDAALAKNDERDSRELRGIDGVGADASTFAKGAQPNAFAAASQDAPQPDLVMTAAGPREFARDGGGQNPDRDRNQDGNDRTPNQRMEADMRFIQKEGQHQIKHAEPKTSFEQTMKMERPSLTQPVVERAQMLVDQGGGSMRIDLGSKELGALDIAVKVTDGTIDLRIMASNDQVRDQLTQDMQTLRDALQRQNLNLRQVEVSMRSGQQWSQSSSQGQSSGRSFQETKEITDVSGVKSNRQVYQQSTSSTRGPVLNPDHQGKIQVLA